MTARRAAKRPDPDEPKRIRYRVIAQGDDTIEDWTGDFEVLEKVRDILQDAEELGRDIDWREVVSGLEGVSLDSHMEDLPYIQDVVELLELVDGVEVGSKQWGGDMPGLSGCWIKVRVRSDRYRQVVGTVHDLVGRLEAYWERSGSRAQSVAAAAEAASRHIHTVVDLEEQIFRLQLARSDAERARVEALTQWCRHVLHEPGLQPKSFEWILIARKRVFFLEEGVLGEPYPDRELHLEVVDQLQSERHPVVRVREALPAHMGRPSWMAGIVYVPGGWRQTQTVLSAQTEELAALATEVRAEYVAGLKRESTAREASQ